ncbi:hypothetical protein LCGC14_1945810 [marine sediment metagenome]|uniref:Uncharacterized protein n=1 Tax=marine sediment metagenome TaxID=412755 RepID=A0A0F9FIX8_9ZZZZ
MKFNITILLNSSLFALMLCSVSLAEAATPVSVATPTQSELSQVLRLSGSLTAEKHAMLSPRVDGLVENVFVDAGSHVDKGDILLTLDPALSKQALAQAKAATAEALAAKNEAERLVKEVQGLRKKNYISESEGATRQSNLNLSNAALLAARAAESSAAEQLLRHQLPAPFSGVINAKMTESGEWVNRGTAVLELVATNAVRLDVKVPQERFAEVNSSSTVEVIPDVMPDMTLKGRITAIVPVSDPRARAFLVRIVIDAKNSPLLPGTSATAVIHLAKKFNEQHWIVPRDALLLHPDGSYSVFVVQNNKAQRRQVTIGQENEMGVTILQGVNEGDQVVVRGNEVLRNDEDVTILKNESK